MPISSYIFISNELATCIQMRRAPDTSARYEIWAILSGPAGRQVEPYHPLQAVQKRMQKSNRVRRAGTAGDSGRCRTVRHWSDRGSQYNSSESNLAAGGVCVMCHDRICWVGTCRVEKKVEAGGWRGKGDTCPSSNQSRCRKQQFNGKTYLGAAPEMTGRGTRFTSGIVPSSQLMLLQVSVDHLIETG